MKLKKLELTLIFNVKMSYNFHELVTRVSF